MTYGTYMGRLLPTWNLCIPCASAEYLLLQPTSTCLRYYVVGTPHLRYLQRSSSRALGRSNSKHHSPRGNPIQIVRIIHAALTKSTLAATAKQFELLKPAPKKNDAPTVPASGVGFPPESYVRSRLVGSPSPMGLSHTRRLSWLSLLPSKLCGRDEPQTEQGSLGEPFPTSSLAQVIRTAVQLVRSGSIRAGLLGITRARWVIPNPVDCFCLCRWL